MNVNDIFFESIYKDIWRDLNPEKMTEKEVDFLTKVGGLQQGDSVLDLMCGYGRHALALAKKGYQVTAVDNLPEYISEIEVSALSEELPLTAYKSSVINFNSNTEEYALVINMGNSLCFFEENQLHSILAKITSSLKPRGRFVLNLWSTLEITTDSFVPESTFSNNECEIRTQSELLHSPNRMESLMTMKDRFGRIETRSAIDYLFSFEEWVLLLQNAGLRLLDAWSIPGQKQYVKGDKRIYFVAEKM